MVKELHYLHEEPHDPEKRYVYQKVTVYQLRKLLGFGLQRNEYTIEDAKQKIKKLQSKPLSWMMPSEKQHRLCVFYINNIINKLLETASMFHRDILVRATQYTTKSSIYENIPLEPKQGISNCFTIGLLIEELQKDLKMLDNTLEGGKKDFLDFDKTNLYIEKYNTLNFDLINILERGELRFVTLE